MEKLKIFFKNLNPDIEVSEYDSVSNWLANNDSSSLEGRLCLVCDVEHHLLFMDNGRRIYERLKAYEKFCQDPQLRPIIEAEEYCWEREAVYVYVASGGKECFSDQWIKEYATKHHLIYHKSVYLKQPTNCDWLHMSKAPLKRNINYSNNIVVPVSFPLWLLKSLLVLNWKSRNYTGPGLYYWVTTDYAGHLCTIHVKGPSKIDHALIPDDQLCNCFATEQEAVDLLNLILDFFLQQGIKLI